MIITLDTFFISDFHLGHDNIIGYCDRPQNHEEVIVAGWNEVVGENDTVLFLGDLALCSREKTKWYTSRMPGKKYMLRGNHDGKSSAYYNDCGFEVTEPIFKVVKNSSGVLKILITHVPVQDLPRGWYNIHGHVHNDDHRGDYGLEGGHINVSCEVLDYKPVKFCNLISSLRGIPDTAVPRHPGTPGGKIGHEIYL